MTTRLPTKFCLNERNSREGVPVLFRSDPTPWDVRFRIFGFPVRVHPLCWLGLAILGQSSFNKGMEYGLIWMACAFASLLWHELGHAFMMRRFGSPAYIELFMLGGHAVPSYTPQQAWRRLLIAAAGPAAGLLVALAVWVLTRTVDITGWNKYLVVALGMLYFINLVWSLLNLLPVWPMDGGHILREVLVLRKNRFADMRTHQISIGVAGALIAMSLFVLLGPPSLVGPVISELPSWLIFFIPGPIMCVFLAMMAFQNYQMLQIVSRPRIHRSDDRVPWER